MCFLAAAMAMMETMPMWQQVFIIVSCMAGAAAWRRANEADQGKA